MTKQVGLVILVLVLGLAVTGPGFRDQIGPDDDVVPSSHPAIRPLEIVTSSVAQLLARMRKEPPHRPARLLLGAATNARWR